MIGIYKIENLVNHKCYIGQAVDINRRWRKHRETYNEPKFPQYEYPLYRAMRKYGFENFSFEVLEECSREELNEKEKIYIEKYNAFFEGYNQTLGGDGSICPERVTKETVIGIISDLENTNMLQREIAEKWSVDISSVNGINTGRTWHHNRKYPIQDSFLYLTRQDKCPTGKRKEDWVCCDCGKQISRGATRCYSCENIRRAKERKSDLPTREELKNLIRTTAFTTIGSMYGVTDNAVRKWCDKYNLPRKVKDIKSYSDEEWELI